MGSQALAVGPQLDHQVETVTCSPPERRRELLLPVKMDDANAVYTGRQSPIH